MEPLLESVIDIWRAVYYFEKDIDKLIMNIEEDNLSKDDILKELKRFKKVFWRD